MEAASAFALTCSLGFTGASAFYAATGVCGLVSAKMRGRKLSKELRSMDFERTAYELRKKAFAKLAAVPALGGKLLHMRSAKRSRELKAGLPQALRLICISLDSGGSLQRALEYASENCDEPLATELRRATWDIKAGQGFDEALEGLRKRVDGPEFGCLAVAMEIQHRCGGTLGDILESVTAMLQQSADLREDLITKTSQGKLSARVVAVMPVVILVALSLLSPDYVRVLFETPAGIFILALAVALELIGIVWVRKSLDIAVPGGEAL